MPSAVKYRVESDANSDNGNAYRRQATSLRKAFQSHRQQLSVGNMEREQAFSWQYCLISLFSYALMLSDVFRTGLGIQDLSQYRTLEADTYIYFGPYAYVTHHLTTANASMTQPTGFWAYKYDTTSVTMRAVAEHLRLDSWPACVLYKTTCDETKALTLAHAFHMVDALVDGVSTYSNSNHRGTLTLRNNVEYKDRVHHYALPWFFERTVKRTSQAIHYTYNASAAVPVKPLCGMSSKRPYSCGQSWTNIARLNCPKQSKSSCPGAGSNVWDMIPERAAWLARVYPNHTIDFVVLDGVEDFSRGGLSYQGRKYFEVVVFTRIQQCREGVCKTVAVDDYRYEAATFVMNALSWYFVVGTLRVVAQAYAWIRLGMLIAGTYYARMHEQRFQDATLMSRVAVTLRTFFLIPSQVIIYGSSFPVTIYMCAHFIDSPAVNEIIAAYFNSMLGQMHWKLEDFINHCAISMRAVWIVGFVCHRSVAFLTRTSWSPIHGVPGAAELTITFIASLTIFAQFRSVKFRSMRILESQEAIPSVRRHQHQAVMTVGSHGTINNLLGGAMIDLQSVLCGILIIATFSFVVWTLHHATPRLVPLRLTLTSSTIAPYSAGMLWPRNRLVVSWYGTVLTIDRGSKTSDASQERKAPDKVASESTSSTQSRHGTIESFKQAQRLYKQLVSIPDKALVMRETTVSQLLQRSMHSVDKRTREIESTVYLINLAAMTDLFTFYDLRVSGGRFVALYVSRVTRRCFMLPFGLTMSEADIPIEWVDQELVAVVNTKELQWHDLLRCG